jgi:hypothetical protein
MTTYPRLTRETWTDFVAKYTAGEFQGQRLGQAAVNYFGLVGQQYLFYVQSEKAACEYVAEMMRDYQL